MLVSTYFRFGSWLCVAAALLVGTTGGASAEDWVVSKASGQVWLASAKAQSVSVGTDMTLRAGDTVQTGANGRALLVRGEETILVAPNSIVSLPEEPTPTGMTTILQSAGSITVRAQKRDHKHFEVQTPYLAAVVKGTEFTVKIMPSTADVSVIGGEVEVADYKSGQIALVLPGQAVRASSKSHGGLTLRGSGTFKPIRQGPPLKTNLQRVHVPRGGLGAPAGKPNRLIGAELGSKSDATGGDVRIKAPIGDIRLDADKATNGLTRNGDRAAQGSVKSEKRASYWSADPPAGGNGNAYAFGNENGGGNGNANGNGNGNGGGGRGKAKGKNKS